MLNANDCNAVTIVVAVRPDADSPLPGSPVLEESRWRVGVVSEMTSNDGVALAECDETETLRRRGMRG